MLQSLNQLRNPLLTIVVVIADLRGGNLKMLEQLAGVASIFGGNQVGAFEDANGPKGDVF
jgi:hypothetical protein